MSIDCMILEFTIFLFSTPGSLHCPLVFAGRTSSFSLRLELINIPESPDPFLIPRVPLVRLNLRRLVNMSLTQFPYQIDWNARIWLSMWSQWVGHGQQKVGKKLSPFRKSKLKIILKLQVFFF